MMNVANRGDRMPAGLPDADVAAAIKDGPAHPKDEVGARAFQRGYRMIALGPLNRVTLAARDAARKYQPFDATKMPPEALAPELLVVAAPAMSRVVDGDIAHVVLKRPDGRVVQPLAIEPTTDAWQNAAPRDSRGDGAVCMGRVPDGPFDSVIVTARHGNERTWRVGGKDRAKVR